jgi:hypothetical protein
MPTKRRAFLQWLGLFPAISISPLPKASAGRRVSVDPDDPGYAPFAHKCRVTLDGADLRYCITADEDLGVALCYVQPLRVACGRIVTEIRRGVIRIIDL